MLPNFILQISISNTLRYVMLAMTTLLSKSMDFNVLLAEGAKLGIKGLAGWQLSRIAELSSSIYFCILWWPGDKRAKGKNIHGIIYRFGKTILICLKVFLAKFHKMHMTTTPRMICLMFDNQNVMQAISLMYRYKDIFLCIKW